MDSVNKNILRAAQVLFLLNTAIWLVLGLASIYRIVSRNPDQTRTAWIIAIFMFGNAAAMLLSGVLIARSARPGYYFALAVLTVNILLTFTDEFGTLDLITLLIDLILVALLVVAGWRRRYSTGG